MTVARGGRVLLNGAEKIFNHCLMAAKIADHGSGSALVFVSRNNSRIFIRRFAQIRRDDPVVFGHLGDTYLKLNRVAKAVESWRKALALDPQNRKIADKIENAKTKLSKGDAPAPHPLQ